MTDYAGERDSDKGGRSAEEAVCLGEAISGRGLHPRLIGLFHSARHQSSISLVASGSSLEVQPEWMQCFPAPCLGKREMIVWRGRCQVV